MKRHRRHRYPKTFYKKLVTSFLLVSAIIIVLVSFVSHAMFSHQFTKEMAANHRRVIDYDGRILSTELFQNAQRLFVDATMNRPNADLFAYYCTPKQAIDHVKLVNIYDTLRSIQKVSSDIISAILVYYPEKNFIISSTAGYKSLNDPLNEAIAEELSAFMQTDPGRLKWWSVKNPNASAVVQKSGLVFGGAISWHSGAGARGQILYAVTPGFVQGLLSNVATEDTIAYLLDESGTVVASSHAENEDTIVPAQVFDAVRQSREKYVNTTDDSSGKQIFYTLSAIPASSFTLALAAPIDSFARTSGIITMQMVVMVLICMVVFLPLTVFISYQLYSPVQQLAATVRQLPDPPEGGLGIGEHDAISAALQRLTAKLGQARQMLYVNAPVLRHLKLQELLSGQSHTLTDTRQESPEASDIHLDFPFFAVILAEWLPEESGNLPEAERSALRFSLIAKIEEAFCQNGCRVYGYTADTGHAAFLLNALQAHSGLIRQIVDSANQIMLQADIRCMFTAGQWVACQEDIPACCKQAQTTMEGRFFAEQETYYLEKTGLGTAPPTQAEERYMEALQSGSALDAAAALRQLVAIWQGQLPALAFESLGRITRATRDAAAMARRSALPQGLLNAPEQTLWLANEYPDALLPFFKALWNQDGETDDLVARTNKYIMANLSEDLSLEAIAAKLHYSPKYFSRLFKEQTGMGISTHVNAMRLAYTAELLTQTSLAVDEIALKAGFNSTQYFIRKFREHYGVTPRQYAKEQQKNKK